jgi:hypothetical protein
MKKLLYIAEGLAILGVFFVLIGGSYSGVSCWCEVIKYILGLDKLAYQQQMIAKYHDKMFTASERVEIASPTEGKSQDRGYISGTVLGEGNPLEGVHVIAWDTSYFRGWGTYTDAQGYYIITHLPEAPEALYKVETDNDLGYVDKFWDNKPNFWSADTVRVVAGDTVKDINFNLQLAGYISGTLTGEGGDGLENFWIYVYDDELNYISGGWPDNFGFYTVGDLEEGVFYRVQASGWGSPYVDEWYNDKPDVVFADTVCVTAQDTTKNIDFELELGGCISGTVTGPGKAPLEGIMIEAYSIVNGGFVRTDWLGTDSLGRYIISGLPLSSGRIGGYRVRSGRSLQYAHQWYSGKFNFRSADVVNLTQPGDTIEGIDFVLTTGGLITGVVTDEYNDSLPGVAIYVYDNTANYPLEPAAFVATYDWPDSLIGLYEVALPPGDYKVRTANLLGYIDEYFDDQTSWDDAALVSVGMSGTTRVDFSLSMGGRIAGTVYETTNKNGVVPLPRVAVAAISANTGEVVTFINSFLDGTYMLSGLPTGWYKLCAVPWADMIYLSFTDLVDIIHAFEFYDDKKNFGTADSIYVVAPDSVVTDIDFVLGAAGAIAGKVYGQSEELLEDAEVTAFGYGSPYYGWIPVWTPGITDEAGDYVVPGLGSGNYKVQAEAEDYPTQWWDSKPDSSSADLVSVTAPDTTKDINFSLSLVGVEEGNEELIYCLYQNYPNPFIGKTRIHYSVANRQHVYLRIYNVTGRLVRTLVNRVQEPDCYIVKWDGTDTNGKKLSSGIYFCRLEVGDFKAANKLILLN